MSRIHYSKHISTSQQVVSPAQAITALSRRRRSTLLHQFFSPTIHCYPTLLPAIYLAAPNNPPQWIFFLPKYFVKCLPRLFHLLPFRFYSPSKTSFLSRRRTHLNKTQHPYRVFLNRPLFCFFLFNNQRNVNTRFTRSLKQLHQHSKAEQLDWKALYLFALQIMNDIALLRYLLFASVGTFLLTENSIHNSTVSPTDTLNPKPTSPRPLLPWTDDTSVCRFTPQGAVGAPRGKTINSASADFQSTPNTQEAPPTTVQNLPASKNSKFEKLLADEIAFLTSITFGKHNQ